MSFHLSTKIYVGEKIFLGQNVISCFLLIFLIKHKRTMKITWNLNICDEIKANFLCQIIVEFY